MRFHVVRCTLLLFDVGGPQSGGVARESLMPLCGCVTRRLQLREPMLKFNYSELNSPTKRSRPELFGTGDIRFPSLSTAVRDPLARKQDACGSVEDAQANQCDGAAGMLLGS
jgi:hypothetical protein